MKTHKASNGTKAVTFILCCLFFALAFGCAVCFGYGYNEGWYPKIHTSNQVIDVPADMPIVEGEEDGRHKVREADLVFLQSDECWYFLHNAAGCVQGMFPYVTQTINENDVLDAVKSAESMNVCVSYVVRELDDDNKVIYDSRGENTPEIVGGIPAVYLSQASYVGDYESLTDDQLFNTYTDNDEDYYTIENKYVVESYLDLPITPECALWSTLHVYRTAYSFHGLYLPAAIIALIVFLICLVVLMRSVGHRPEEPVSEDEGVTADTRRFRLARLPWDVFTVVIVAIFVAIAALSGMAMDYFDTSVTAVSGAALIVFSATTGVLAIITLLVTQIKDRTWWNSTLLSRLCRLIARGCREIARIVPGQAKLFVAIVILGIVNVAAGVTGLYWGALIIALACDIAAIVVIVKTLRQCRELGEVAEAIASGDVTRKADMSIMRGGFLAHAENLNNIGGGIEAAVEERLKSERLKTELITNVSHDLKTPLTSIVSYVDLLSREEIDNEQAREYIEVLQRQSQRLKKLTEDVVDASKASSGAYSVNIGEVVLNELLSQSVGEYSERLQAAEIVPVLTLPEDDVVLQTDGRLLWRVIDNLLGNVAKYAQPGTRAYIKLYQVGSDEVQGAQINTYIVIKNVSREPLDISVDELLERFVQGDASRNTEGSGLGLSIAKSLTELIGGTLGIEVDGDLFKVTLRF